MSDYIDRRAAIACAISGRTRTLPTSEDGENWIRTEEVRQSLLAIPAADVAPVRHGRWEMAPDLYGFFKEIPVCSACSCTTKWREKYMYCPNCGARMDGEQDG